MHSEARTVLNWQEGYRIRFFSLAIHQSLTPWQRVVASWVHLKSLRIHSSFWRNILGLTFPRSGCTFFCLHATRQWTQKWVCLSAHPPANWTHGPDIPFYPPGAEGGKEHTPSSWIDGSIPSGSPVLKGWVVSFGWGTIFSWVLCPQGQLLSSSEAHCLDTFTNKSQSLHSFSPPDLKKEGKNPSSCFKILEGEVMSIRKLSSRKCLWTCSHWVWLHRSEL